MCYLYKKLNSVHITNSQCCLNYGHTQFTLRGVYLSFVCPSCSVFADVHSVFLMEGL